MGRIEILSPAGGEEQLIAAVRSGADAVYLGTRAFNARAKAENFGDDLPRIVSYCHARNVKVNVTVNTLVRDRELDELYRTVDMVALSGADRAIIQDLAVYRYAKDHWPDLKLSASTQMAVHNTDGARMLEDMGYDCIVLARELSLEEMRRVCESVHIECEAFIHGAHCMSVSGACYLSVMLGGRSGNRGLCAQPCRLDFKNAQRNFALSLKDMSLISHIHEMNEAGVTSFKIEGRMKRPEYVAAVTNACVRARDGLPYDEELLRNVFSRSGFTDGYLTGRRNGAMFGTRTAEDRDRSESVMSSLRELYRAERMSVPYRASLSLSQDVSHLTVTDGTHTVETDAPAAEIALSRPTEAGDVERAFGKTGGTPFVLESAALDNPARLVLPASALNSLRRAALAELLLRREENPPRMKRETVRETAFPHSPADEMVTVARCENAQQASMVTEGCVTLPAELITKSEAEQFGGRLIAEIPHICFPQDEDALRDSVRSCALLGVTRAMCDNLYAIRMAKESGLIPVGGLYLNIMNSVALEEYRTLGLESAAISFELPLTEAKRLTGDIPRGVAVYGSLPLMRMRSCPNRSEKGCGKCDGSPRLTDRMGVEFPVLCSSRRYSSLLNSVPLDLIGRDIKGYDFALLYFTNETPAQVKEVLRRYAAGERSTQPHTTGMAWKDLP